MVMTGQPTFTPPVVSIGGGATFSPFPANMPDSMTAANAIQNWPDHSVYVKCLCCQRSGYTKVERQLRANILCLVIFLFFVVFVASLLLLCCDSSYQTEHQCVHCGTKLGLSK